MTFKHTENIELLKARIEKLERMFPTEHRLVSVMHSAPANVFKPVVVPAPKPVPKAPKPVGRTGFYDNAMFIDALTHEFQDVYDVVRKLAHTGVSKGTAYNRLKALAADPRSMVDRDGDNYAYRLKTAPVTAPKARTTRTRKSSAASSRIVSRKVAREFWDDGIRVTLTIG